MDFRYNSRTDDSAADGDSKPSFSHLLKPRKLPLIARVDLEHSQMMSQPFGGTGLAAQ